ncbi:MAG: HNH endonuclease [Actinomycetota bacterium]|nr:HNH endonuclease [Actinomycetota bacterium]
MTNVAELSDDQVVDEITTWAGRIAAGEARLLTLIGEFDRREAWSGPGLLSCAHWLSWRLGVGLTAAHERVRVARALKGLPLVAAAFGAGRLSWTQVRAITRVATGADEASWVRLARSATGAQLERLVRGVRRAQRIEEDAADPEHAAWRNEARIAYDEDGTLVLTVRFPAEQGAVVLAALEQARAALDHQEKPAAQDRTEFSAEESPPAATIAEGLVQLARLGLDAMSTARPEAARRTRSRLVAHLDPLSGWGRLADGELLPPSTLLALQTPAVRLRPLTSGDLTQFDLGRTQRLPSLVLRELLGTVDGDRCRFPACTRHRKLHAHHVRFWSQNGATDLANLLLLCSRHHTLVHAQGFQLLLRPDRSLRVTTADGTAVLHHPALPWRPAAELDPDEQITTQTLPPYVTGQRLDLGYAVNVLLQQAA